MKILITGGTGFIARNINHYLTNMGHRVFAPSHKELDLLNFKEWDIFSNYLRLERFDAIIHTATKGGRRGVVDTFEDVYVPNVRMFENLYLSAMRVGNWRPKIIIFGSGAEFDRRNPIQNRMEHKIFDEWPVDPYGLSKNVIARRALTDLKDIFDIYILRLFGCFGYDEADNRFIKSAINNVKQNKDIEVTNDIEFDFFYIEDVATVIDYVLNTRSAPNNINLVYKDKIKLSGVAQLVSKHMSQFNPRLSIKNDKWDSYTGYGQILSQLTVAPKLLGLEEGIRRTVEKLL